jgi:hypothetical protein
MKVEVIRCWLAYVDTLPWERGYLDPSSHAAFLRAGSLGVDSEIAFKEVCERIRAAGDHPRRSKINNQLRRAYEFTKTANAVRRFHEQSGREFKPRFNPEFAERFAKQVSTVKSEWLRRQSTVQVLLTTPADFLWQLYRAGDRVLIFTDQRSQGEV